MSVVVRLFSDTKMQIHSVTVYVSNEDIAGKRHSHSNCNSYLCAFTWSYNWSYKDQKPEGILNLY